MCSGEMLRVCLSRLLERMWVSGYALRMSGAITAGRRAKAVTGAAIAAWVFDVGCGWSTTRVALRLGISHELVRKRQMQARRLVRQQLLGPGEPEVGRADC